MAKAAKYIAILGCFLTATAAVAAVVAARRYGNDAYLASGLAAGLVWFVGSMSLVFVALAKSPQARLNAALFGMLVRMAAPLGAIVYFSRSEHPLVAAGIIGFIVIHYLVGLVVETLLSVRLVGVVDAAPPPVQTAT